MASPDPLEDLLIDDASVARDELAAALRPYLQFERGGAVWLLDDFEPLSSRLKVLCLLLAIKAQHLLGLRDSESATPQQVAELGAMSPGTVRPTLTKLAKSREVTKAGRGGYVVPDANARRVVRELKEAS